MRYLALLLCVLLVGCDGARPDKSRAARGRAAAALAVAVLAGNKTPAPSAPDNKPEPPDDPAPDDDEATAAPAPSVAVYRCASCNKTGHIDLLPGERPQPFARCQSCGGRMSYESLR